MPVRRVRKTACPACLSGKAVRIGRKTACHQERKKDSVPGRGVMACLPCMGGGGGGVPAKKKGGGWEGMWSFFPGAHALKVTLENNSTCL